VDNHRQRAKGAPDAVYGITTMNIRFCSNHVSFGELQVCWLTSDFMCLQSGPAKRLQ
jgi:hypothetical protein